MWWNPDYFVYLNNNSLVHNTMLDVYRDYFHRDGLFLTRFYDLIHNYNVTVLWCDKTPAGSCTIHDHNEYHVKYMNLQEFYHTIELMNQIIESCKK